MFYFMIQIITRIRFLMLWNLYICTICSLLRITYLFYTDEYLCTSPKESIGSSTFCDNELSTLEKHYDEAETKYIWHKTIENCQSKSLKSFLLKEGRLSSILVDEGKINYTLDFTKYRLIIIRCFKAYHLFTV